MAKNRLSVRALSNKNILLFFILLAGALLRILLLNKEIWFDEALTLYTARQPLNELFSLLDKGFGGQPHLFPLLVRSLQKISSSFIWIRCWLLGFSLISLYMTYRIGKIIFNETVGLLSCALMAFSKIYISFSIEIRCYSVWILLSLFSIFFFLKSSKKPSLKNMTFLVLSTTLCIYAHYFGLFILLVQFLMLFLNRKMLQGYKKVWMAFFASMIILLIPVMVHQMGIFLKTPIWVESYRLYPSHLKDSFQIFFAYSNGRLTTLLIFAVMIHVIILNLKKLFPSGLTPSKFLIFLNFHIEHSYQKSFILLYILLPIFLSCGFMLFGLFFLAYSRYYLPFMISYYWIISWCIYFESKIIRSWISAGLIILMLNHAVIYSKYTP